MARPKDKPVIPREKTVLLDHFGVGETWGYENQQDGRLCSGEPVSHDKDEQSSFMYRWRNNYEKDC